MEDTGRIREPLDWRARAIVFDRRDAPDVRDELALYVQIDRAHLVMLVECGILPPERGHRVLGAIESLATRRFAPLTGRAAPRGLYLLYEHWLCETLGEQLGGAVHLGRSRNDINATMMRLRLRPVYHRLVRELLRLLAVLVRTAERYADMTMPVYTHYQAAVPITYGHYLAGVAVAVLRDLRGIEDAADELDRCPLGAGAAGGTSVPIDTERTARFLGFTRSVLHSVDAVAARDFVLRLLAAASVLGITLSRLATDFLLWSTAEFDLLRFPDTLVGSSSMMPQKRNAFLLEHVQGRAGAPVGAFTAASMAMHATPFSNSVAVGTEAVEPLWRALEQLTESAVLMQLVTAGARPQARRMRRRAADGYTAATELANRLVLEAGLSFRQAHRRVGELVSRASARGEALDAAAERLLGEYRLPVEVNRLDPASAASRAAYGGGAAAASFARIIVELRSGWAGAARRLRERSRQWSDGRRVLTRAIADICQANVRPVGGAPAQEPGSVQ